MSILLWFLSCLSLLGCRYHSSIVYVNFWQPMHFLWWNPSLLGLHVKLLATDSYIKMYFFLDHFTAVDDSWKNYGYWFYNCKMQHPKHQLEIFNHHCSHGKWSSREALVQRPSRAQHWKQSKWSAAWQGRSCGQCRAHGSSNTLFFCAILVQMPEALMDIQSKNNSVAARRQRRRKKNIWLSVYTLRGNKTCETSNMQFHTKIACGFNMFSCLKTWHLYGKSINLSLSDTAKMWPCFTQLLL
jgi:hypothetical protein